MPVGLSLIQARAGLGCLLIGVDTDFKPFHAGDGDVAARGSDDGGFAGLAGVALGLEVDGNDELVFLNFHLYVFHVCPLSVDVSFFVMPYYNRICLKLKEIILYLFWGKR